MIAEAKDTESLDDLRERHEKAKLLLESAQLEAETAHMEQVFRNLELTNSTALRESYAGYGDFVDPREWLNDDPAWGRPAAPMAMFQDRWDGRNYPVFRTQQELAIIRGTGRLLCASFPAAISIQENLVNYTIAKGFKYTGRAMPGASPELVKAFQHVLDTFNRDNTWEGDAERELHKRAREDGEFFLQLKPNGWRTKIHICEPEQVLQPASTRELEDWIGCYDEFVSSWTFGVHCRLSDIQDPLGYHLIFDQSGYDWDYVPVERLEHYKANVVRNVKRGVSDFWPARVFLEKTEKLLTNTVEGSAVQAAIAYIREHADTTTTQQATAFQGANQWNTYTRPSPQGGQPRIVTKLGPGTVLDVRGAKYLPGPMGSDRAPNFIAAIQAALRYTGTRWCMPEYMISADASNANMASSLVAESPFVKAREADQNTYANTFRRVMWKVARIAFEAGYFDSFGLASFDELQRLIEIDVKLPSVATRDRYQAAQAAEIECRMGILSRRTACEESGRDYDAEVAAGAKPDAAGTESSSTIHQDTSNQPQSIPGSPSSKPPSSQVSKTAPVVQANAGLQTDLTLNGAQVTAAIELLADVRTKIIAPEAAIKLLVGVGMSHGDAEQMIQATVNLPDLSPEQIANARSATPTDATRRINESLQAWRFYP